MHVAIDGSLLHSCRDSVFATKGADECNETAFVQRLNAAAVALVQLFYYYSTLAPEVKSSRHERTSVTV